MKRYLLLLVGCLECGYETKAIKTFESIQEIDTWFEASEVTKDIVPAVIKVGSQMDDDGSTRWAGQQKYVIVDLIA